MWPQALTLSSLGLGCVSGKGTVASVQGERLAALVAPSARVSTQACRSPLKPSTSAGPTSKGSSVTPRDRELVELVGLGQGTC